MISLDLSILWYPECSTCKSSQNRTGMHFFHKMLKIEPYMFPMKNLILGIENPCLGLLFKRISFLKKFLSQKSDFEIWIFMLFLACFWSSQIRFFPKSCNFVKMALNTKIIDVFLVKLVILNNFSLYYIWIWNTL